VRPGSLITQADQYMVSAHQELFNSLGAFYEVVVEGADESLQSEPTHVLVWLSPHEALRRLRHDSHAWAVATWLRRR
jgi:8-oxo-dGTP diphosphatase